MSSTPLNELATLGQSIWYDNIHRSLLQNGELAQMIQEDSVTGLTSNPTIFEKAIAHSDVYDDQIQALLEQAPNMAPVSLYESLAIRDIVDAADLMRPVYDRTNSADGYVSLEVSPTLAHDTEGSIEEARRLFSQVDRPNLMIKIPATPAGIPAIATLIGEGINVNVTLMFSLQHYEDVVNAYLTGLEKFDKQGGDVSKVSSVASFFISRVDTIFDKTLEVVNSEEALKLQGKIGIANAKAAYHRFHEITASKRFQSLAQKGARVQRLLWASTSTKNPEFRDVLYVEELLGADTVNTLPPATLLAFKDHGIAQIRLSENMDEALAVMDMLDPLGVDYQDLTNILQTDGVNSFAKSFKELLKALETKRDTLSVGVA
ncbi:MAG: transaldolase [Chloroflexota bacterium]